MALHRAWCRLQSRSLCAALIPLTRGWTGNTQLRAQEVVVGAAILLTPGLDPGALMQHFPRLAWLCALSYKAAQRGLWHLAGEGTLEGQG